MINVQPNDTLKIKFVNNDFFSKDINHHEDFLFTQDSLKNEVIYSNEVKFIIKKTDKPQPYLQIERLAEGKSFDEANKRAEKIKYSFKVNGNQLLLDNYLVTEMASKYRNQKVEVYLYLPEGIVYYPDENVTNFLEASNSDFDYYYGPEGYKYKVKNNDLICLNCPDDESENNDLKSQEINITNDNDSTETVTVKINGKVITETKSGKKSSLKLNKDGILIKTN